MEVKEFLTQNDVIVASSSKELAKMLKAYETTGDIEKSFKRVHLTRSKEAMTPKAFLNFIQDHIETVKSIHSGVTDLHSAICYVVNEIIGSKESAVAEITAKRIADSTVIPDYYIKAKVMDEPIDIFETIEGKANDKDKDLYKCFCNAGEQIVFTSNEMTKLILQNNDGSLAFGNDLLSLNESSLFACICRSMQSEFIAYKEKLRQKLASLNNDDLDIEENAVPVIEKIFLDEVPCSFRHIVTVCKRFRKGEDDKLWFDGFVVKPNKKMIEHFDFDSFLTALSKNFQRMTRGALKHQNEYKAFSNRFDEAAVTHWTLPSEDCWKKASLPKKWAEFFKDKAEARILQRLFWYIGAMQDANNVAEQALIISDGGGTGKSTMLEVLYKLFPNDFFGFIPNSALDDKKDFELSARKTYEHHCLVLDEYDGKSINSPVFKNLIGTKTPISMSVKNKQAISHNFKGTKMIVLSNEVSMLDTHAYRRRVIPISFRINHKGREAFNSKDIDELIESGKDFLNFCYRLYKQCKCIKPNGEYYVLSPELEEAYLKGEDIRLSEDTISMKAISNDEEISEYFNVHDYEESEMSIDMTEFANEYLDFPGLYKETIWTKDQQKMTVKTLIALTEKKINSSENEKERAKTLFSDSVRQTQDGFLHINPYNKRWWIYKQTLETMGAEFRAVKVNGKVCKTVLGLYAKDVEEAEYEH
jgi:hypothetical protein